MCTRKLLPLLLCAVHFAALKAQENGFCNDLLPVSLIKEVCGAPAFDVTVKTAGSVKETSTQCNRMYGKGTPDWFKDNLLLTVSPITANRTAREVIQNYAQGQERRPQFQYLTDLGDYGVRFAMPDKGAGDASRVVAFVKNGLLIELKDTYWSEQSSDSFIANIEQLQAIAERVAARILH